MLQMGLRQQMAEGQRDFTCVCVCPTFFTLTSSCFAYVITQSTQLPPTNWYWKVPACVQRPDTICMCVWTQTKNTRIHKQQTKSGSIWSRYFRSREMRTTHTHTNAHKSFLCLPFSWAKLVIWSSSRVTWVMMDDASISTSTFVNGATRLFRGIYVKFELKTIPSNEFPTSAGI